MTKEEFENIREFAGRLAELRHQVADGQLLDRCEQVLRELIEHAALNFEDYPTQETEAVTAEPPHDVEPPRAESEPEPPPPSHSEPKHEVRHTGAHKRPTARKTHR